MPVWFLFDAPEIEEKEQMLFKNKLWCACGCVCVWCVCGGVCVGVCVGEVYACDRERKRVGGEREGGEREDRKETADNKKGRKSFSISD